MLKTPVTLSNSVTDKPLSNTKLWRKRDGTDPYYVRVVRKDNNFWTVEANAGAEFLVQPEAFQLEYEEVF